MIQKKICMLGSFAVGKTSLVQRFVQSTYSDRYHSTIGVKIDKKPLTVGDVSLSFMLWDIQGDDGKRKVHMSYLRGASGYLLVVDGTRGETVQTALRLQQTVEQSVGRIPFVCVLNKVDLADMWEIDDGMLREIASRGWPLLRTSAKTSEGVEEAFQTLARCILYPDSTHNRG
jgi:small GTP-binding protein